MGPAEWRPSSLKHTAVWAAGAEELAALVRLLTFRQRKVDYLDTMPETQYEMSRRYDIGVITTDCT